MEILLNVLWLLVSAAIAGIWLAQSRKRHRWVGPGLQALALACTAIFLFPVISATDDLQAAAIAVEIPDSKKNPNKLTENGWRPNVTGSSIAPVLLQSHIFAIIDSDVIILSSEGGSDPSPISFHGPLENRPPPSRA
jgi:hypothetical protein